MHLRPILQPLTDDLLIPLTRLRAGGGGGNPQPGDYLLDESFNFLTDESGNRLTA